MARGFLSEREASDMRRGASDGERVTVDVILARDFDLSWGVYEPAHHGEMIWLPKSLTTLTGGKQPKREAQVTMPRWLARKKGLI